jgi:threonine dehydratase
LLLDRIIGHGLVKVGRLLALVSEAGANIRTIEHERTWRDVSIGETRVTLELETRCTEHVAELRRHLAGRGYRLVVDDGS